MQEPARVALSIVGIIIILIGAYYATYFIGLKASGQSRRNKGRGRNRSINLLERFAISKDKSFCVVEIAGKIYIIGMTNQAMTVLDTLKPEQYAEAAPESHYAATWKAGQDETQSETLMGKLVSFMSKKSGRAPTGTDNETGRTDSFAQSMKYAQEKNTSECSKSGDAGRTEGSGGEE